MNNIKEAWLVILLSLVFGATLAGVQATLKVRIEQNKLNKTLHQIPSLVPGAERGEAETVGAQTVYRAVTADGKTCGWVIPCNGQGFADRLELLVGVDESVSHITGLYVVDQKETPGLGNFITEDWWRKQFNGKPLKRELVVIKTKAKADNEIEAVTGATISSASVVGIVNGAIYRFRMALKAQGDKQGS